MKLERFQVLEKVIIMKQPSSRTNSDRLVMCAKLLCQVLYCEFSTSGRTVSRSTWCYEDQFEYIFENDKRLSRNQGVLSSWLQAHQITREITRSSEREQKLYQAQPPPLQTLQSWGNAYKYKPHGLSIHFAQLCSIQNLNTLNLGK